MNLVVVTLFINLLVADTLALRKKTLLNIFRSCGRKIPSAPSAMSMGTGKKNTNFKIEPAGRKLRKVLKTTDLRVAEQVKTEEAGPNDFNFKTELKLPLDTTKYTIPITSTNAQGHIFEVSPLLPLGGFPRRELASTKSGFKIMYIDVLKARAKCSGLPINMAFYYVEVTDGQDRVVKSFCAPDLSSLFENVQHICSYSSPEGTPLSVFHMRFVRSRSRQQRDCLMISFCPADKHYLECNSSPCEKFHWGPTTLLDECKSTTGSIIPTPEEKKWIRGDNFDNGNKA